MNKVQLQETERGTIIKEICLLKIEFSLVSRNVRYLKSAVRIIRVSNDRAFRDTAGPFVSGVLLFVFKITRK